MNEPVLVTPAVVDDRRRLKVLVGIGVVLVLLLLVVPRVLGGGSDGGDDLAQTPAATPTSTTVAPPEADLAARPVSDKDPFAPLVAPRPPAPAAPVVKADTAAKRIRLDDVYADAAGRPTAKVRLDGKDLAVKDGQQFAGSYRVLGLDLTARCGNFLFGDQPFSLCAGEETSF